MPFIRIPNTGTGTTISRLGFAAIGATFLLSGCGGGEREPTTSERLKGVQQRQETKPDFYVARKTTDYMADLKNLREPPTPAKPAPSQPAPVPAPTVTVAPTPAPPTKATLTPPPEARTIPAPTPVVVAPTVSAPVVSAPAPVSRAADTTVTVVSREQPTFPREAVRQGIDGGVVRARVIINAAGEVSAVDILSSRPARVFDREVQVSLARWRFNPGADGRTLETEINFQR